MWEKCGKVRKSGGKAGKKRRGETLQKLEACFASALLVDCEVRRQLVPVSRLAQTTLMTARRNRALASETAPRWRGRGLVHERQLSCSQRRSCRVVYLEMLQILHRRRRLRRTGLSLRLRLRLWLWLRFLRVFLLVLLLAALPFGFGLLASGCTLFE